MLMSRSWSPCSSRTGTSISRSIAAYRLRSASTHSRDCAAVSISESTSGYARRWPASSACRSTISGAIRSGSAQHSANRSRTDRATDASSRGRRTIRRPSTGTMNAPNVANTLGSGRARSAGGSAGSTSTRPATVSARRAAWRMEISPPIELPIRIAGVPATSTRNLWRRRLFACTDVDREPPRVCPKPARSMATTRQVCARVGATAAQLSADPPRPCTHTSSGASDGPPKSR